jgi:subtilisin family serine protease
MRALNRNKGAFVLGLLTLAILSFSFQKNPVPFQGINFGDQSFTSPRAELPYVEGQILVKFKPSLPLIRKAAALVAYQLRAVNKISGLDVYIAQIPEKATVEEIVYAMNRNPDVEYAEPNYTGTIAVTPNDFFFRLQYALSNIGQEVGSIPGSPQGKPSCDIKAPSAWEETKGKENVVIAICDTGVDLTHPDLKNKLKNSGRDVVNNDFDATDDNGHGTAVAGIAGAETNNNEGIAGVAWKCKILPVKVAAKDGTFDMAKISEGIKWAADNGADVINLSLQSNAASQTLRDALSYAYDKNIVIVAAAGNSGAAVTYPAAYDSYCLAVAATDYNDARWPSSNYGSEIDVAAPGVKIYSTAPQWLVGADQVPYKFWDGTSMAAPHVAGLAALIKSIKPWLKASEIMDIIRYSADDVNADKYPGKDEYIGYGRINMEKALVPLKITKKE